MHHIFYLLAMISTLFISGIAQAGFIDTKDVAKNKHTLAGLYLDSIGAYEYLKKPDHKILFVDVRTRAEIAFLGMPDSADANIPFKFISKKYKWDNKKQKFKMRSNDDFVSRVASRMQQKGLGKNDLVFVMCRSGGRSAKAADALTKAGYTQVVSIIDGFEGDVAKSGINKGKRAVNGWKNSDLPWSEKLDKSKMYLQDDLKNKDKALKMLEKMDIDKDGIISQEEFAQHHTQMFGKLDQDHNHTIDAEEMKQFKAKRKLDKQEAKAK